MLGAMRNPFAWRRLYRAVVVPTQNGDASSSPALRDLGRIPSQPQPRGIGRDKASVGGELGDRQVRLLPEALLVERRSVQLARLAWRTRRATCALQDALAALYAANVLHEDLRERREEETRSARRVSVATRP